MTETLNPQQPPRWLPLLRSRWWTVVLGLSLMANLLIVGLAAGTMWKGRGDGRMQGASYVQLVPRSFFRDISKDRRDVLMQIVRGHRDDLRELRKASDAASLKLADVLDRNPSCSTMYARP
jgi:hypothetical protein